MKGDILLIASIFTQAQREQRGQVRWRRGRGGEDRRDEGEQEAGHGHQGHHGADMSPVLSLVEPPLMGRSSE